MSNVSRTRSRPTPSRSQCGFLATTIALAMVARTESAVADERGLRANASAIAAVDGAGAEPSPRAGVALHLSGAWTSPITRIDAGKFDRERAVELSEGVAEQRAGERKMEEIGQAFMAKLGNQLGYGHPLSKLTTEHQFTWTPEALARLEEVPSFCREMSKWRVEWTAVKKDLRSGRLPSSRRSGRLPSSRRSRRPPSSRRRGRKRRPSPTTASRAFAEAGPNGASLDPIVKDDGRREGGPAWYKDPIGGALVGVGVVGVGVGVGLFLSGRAADRDADSTESYAEFLELKDRAESRGKLGVISMSAGGVLVASGIAWYVLRAGGGDDSEGTAVGAWLDERSGGLSVAARF